MTRLQQSIGLVVALGMGSGFLGGMAPALAHDGLNVEAIFAACRAAAESTSSPLRPNGHTKMWCAVVDREGRLLVIRATDTGGTPHQPAGSDAWRGSIEIAIAKAYTAVAFSSNQQALDSKTIGLLARTDGPGSTSPSDIGTNAGVAPLFGIGGTNPYRPLTGFNGLNPDDSVGLRHHGIVTFAGGQPIYTKPDGKACGGGVLIGALGVSGDGVDQDDIVAKAGVLNAGFCLHP
jgi:uncharacterized protein GlcG (DUF336 family)